mmetsp:Transcript_27748/g.50702  ORF Transcript_27748/g.50702 Transcript_27748/m.50702 type:complete len:188 (+) Transcript_27748:59-622(+)
MPQSRNSQAIRLVALLIGLSVLWTGGPAWSQSPAGRRHAVGSFLVGGGAGVAAPQRGEAKEVLASELLDMVKVQRRMLGPLPKQVDAEEFDAVRYVLKTPPVQYIWDCAYQRNTVRRLGEVLGDEEIMTTMDDVATALQNAEQYLYSNDYVYTQPGDGKFHLIEPKLYLNMAMDSLDGVIKRASSQI